MIPICTEWWCTEANEATQTHCYNPIAPAYPIWAYYAHGRQRRCQEDPVSFPSGRLEKTTRSSPHHVAQHRPTGSETTPPYAPRSSRYGSEPPSMSTYGATQSWVACQKWRRRAQGIVLLKTTRQTGSNMWRQCDSRATRFLHSAVTVWQFCPSSWLCYGRQLLSIYL